MVYCVVIRVTIGYLIVRGLGIFHPIKIYLLRHLHYYTTRHCRKGTRWTVRWAVRWAVRRAVYGGVRVETSNLQGEE